MKIKYANGQVESLDFAPLSITERYTFTDHLVEGRTPQLVAHCARRNIEWVNSLDQDCFLELAKEFIRGNFPMAMKIAQADPIAALKVGPLLFKMGQVLSLLPSTSSAPTPSTASAAGDASPSAPPPAASAPATMLAAVG
jgi:hypothetical protein